MKRVHVIAITIEWIILVVSTIGNISLMITLKRRFTRSSRFYHCLMFNLAVADTMFLYSTIPFDFVERLHSPRFPFGPFLCKIISPFQTTVVMTSIYTVVALSCQRYCMIVRISEDAKECRKTTLLATILALWLVPIILAGIPLAIALEYENHTCQETWSSFLKRYFTVYLTFIQYIGPLFVITLCNGRAVIKLKR